MSAPFMVKALFEYSSPHEDDLPFPAGQIITVTEVEDDDWYTGEFVGDDGVKHEGIFPRNFVEKYEPVAPPRPTRTRPKKESEPTAAATSPPPPAPAAVAAPDPVEEPTPSEPAQPPKAESQFASEPTEQAPTASGTAPAASAASPPASEPAAPIPIAAPPASIPKAEPQATSPPAPKAAPSASKPSGPPPVAEKPTGNAFKDRIAAFNRAAAPPITPFKPSGLGGSSFIKKPFVAPPPSRNAFVPQPQSAPAPRVYRRDEDPEIKEREQENQETAEKIGLVPTTSNEGEDEDQPKPMSLKERMALLQKQQQEQAQRHADAAAKKEKPKRPAKKRMESNEGAEEDGSSQLAPPLERKDSEDTAGRRSIDESQGPRAAPVGRRKSSAKALGGEPYDGNEADMSGAGDTTEGQEDVTEREDSDDRSHHVPRSSVAAGKAPAVDEEDEEEDDEEEEDIDPEVRRKEELRARMAKMSGGMGMAGMFGMPMPGLGVPAKKKKTSAAVERRDSEGPESVPSPGLHAPPVPAMVALPGLATRRSEDKAAEEVAPAPAPPKDEEEDDAETPSQSAQSPPSVPSRMSMSGAPPVPGNRPVPPPVPSEARPPPVPPIAGVKSPSAGSESDDELSEHPMQEPLATPRGEPTPASRAPPPPPPGPPPVEPSSPRSPGPRQQSFFGGGDEASPTSPTASSMSNKRASRPPPPIPTMPPSSPPPAASRPPPPPPPGGLSRRSTADNRPLSPTKASRKELSDEEEITEYEGDYDTDIASSVPHKDALKSHGRDSSIDETTSVSSPTATAPPTLPPPIPSVNAPRAPPPIPNQPPPAPKTDYRRSVDMPRMAPPPPPPQKETPQHDDDYDPYNYSAPSQGVSAAPGYAPPPPKSPRSPEIPHTSEAPYQPPPPPPGVQQSSRAPRQSLDVGRASHSGRRSVDIGPSMDSHFVANDIDLAPSSSWWTQPNGLPPQLQGRKDIFFESEQSVSAQGSKSMVTRDIYILYHDYSQTVITVLYDGKNPTDVHLSQRHEPPPRTLRQDQLEQSYERFGRQIAEAVKGKKETVVGDGTPYGLVQELLRPHKDALLPVGTRAYGALVYANMANASTTVNDEIRPGDIMSIRNAKFSGKHGALGHKYSMEVGRPDHVAVVAEWDGSKKKVRAWEQGRESKKTKLESFRLDDLRSGEVKIWRVMPRSWVGWEGQN